MATKTFVYPYRQGSRSATALAQGVEGKVIRLRNSKFRGSQKKAVINWGSTEMSEEALSCGMVFNHPDRIRSASNKRTFFEVCTREEGGPRVPDWTLDKGVAEGWLNNGRNVKIFARTVLAGHSGEGIVKVTSVEDLEPIEQGTLLVRYVPKRHEFRVHVGRGGVIISTQQKKKRLELANDEVDFEVRNSANGFVFARNDIEVPEDVYEQSRLALAATDLDFGAVDVIYNQRQESAYAIEVNTAPGLEGSTVLDYANYFNEVINNDI